MTSIVTPCSTFDPARIIPRLHRRLDFAMKTRYLSDARECAAVARFLASELGTVPAQALAARATAAAKFLEVNRYV